MRVDLHITILDNHDAVTDGMAVSAVFTRPDHTAQPVPVTLGHAAPGYTTGSVIVPSHGEWDLALTLRATDGSQQTLTQAINVT